MSAEKILETWKAHVPPQVDLDDVLLVAREKFESVKTPTRGGHYKVSHGKLRKFAVANPEYMRDCPFGIFDIPTVSGRRVKRYYVKRMIELINIIEQMAERGL